MTSWVKIIFIFIKVIFILIFIYFKNLKINMIHFSKEAYGLTNDEIQKCDAVFDAISDGKN